MSTRGKHWFIFDPKEVNEDKCVQEARDESKVSNPVQVVHLHSDRDPCHGFVHHFYKDGNPMSEAFARACGWKPALRGTEPVDRISS